MVVVTSLVGFAVLFPVALFRGGREQPKTEYRPGGGGKPGQEARFPTLLRLRKETILWTCQESADARFSEQGQTCSMSVFEAKAQHQGLFRCVGVRLQLSPV